MTENFDNNYNGEMRGIEPEGYDMAGYDSAIQEPPDGGEIMPEPGSSQTPKNKGKKAAMIVTCVILCILLAVTAGAIITKSFYPDIWNSLFGIAETEPESETETELITEPETETETMPATEPETEPPTEAPTEAPKEQNNGGSNTGGTTSKKQSSNNNGGSNTGNSNKGDGGNNTQSTAPKPEPEPEPPKPSLNPDSIVSSASSRLQGKGYIKESRFTTSDTSWSGIYTSNYKNPTNDYIVEKIVGSYNAKEQLGANIQYYNITYSSDGNGGYIFYLMWA